MRTCLRLLVLAALLVGCGLLVSPARAETTLTITPCGEQGTLLSQTAQGTLPSGALSLICVPLSGWNGDLVIYAHGYTSTTEPLAFQNLVLPDGSYLPDIVLGLHYAFATTSYRQNGLAILEGAQDIRELVKAFPSLSQQVPNHTYLTGVSEGGLITTLLIEQYSTEFSGGLAACGPIGSFRDQIDHFGNFRVLFDYFFPGVLPRWTMQNITIPADVSANWENVYVPRIKRALAANRLAAAQLISTSKAATDLLNSATIETTTLHLLWYNVFATNDGLAKLGGNAFDNHNRWYWGSSNDLRLNATVARFSASSQALANMMAYETSGNLTKPLDIMHTSGDEIIPFWQATGYVGKVLTSGHSGVTPIVIFRYGHCNFTASEVLATFGLLVLQVTGRQPAGIRQQVDVAQAQRNFIQAQHDVEQVQQLEKRVQAQHQVSP
jgi:hypothetical protein